MKASIKLDDMFLSKATTQMLIEVIGGWEWLDFKTQCNFVNAVRECKKSWKQDNKLYDGGVNND